MNCTIILNEKQAVFINEELKTCLPANELIEIDRPLALRIRDFAQLEEVDASIEREDSGSEVLSDRGKVACSVVDLMIDTLNEI
jgi:hypothetical protein